MEAGPRHPLGSGKAVQAPPTSLLSMHRLQHCLSDCPARPSQPAALSWVAPERPGPSGGHLGTVTGAQSPGLSLEGGLCRRQSWVWFPEEEEAYAERAWLKAPRSASELWASEKPAVLCAAPQNGSEAAWAAGPSEALCGPRPDRLTRLYSCLCIICMCAECVQEQVPCAFLCRAARWGGGSAGGGFRG